MVWTPAGGAADRSRTRCGSRWAAATGSSHSRTRRIRTHLRRIAGWSDRAPQLRDRTEHRSLKPQYRPRYDIYEDSVLIERGDTTAQADPGAEKAHRRLSCPTACRLHGARSALQLEHAVLHLAAQPADDLHRRQSRTQVDETRRRHVPDLARSIDRRYDEDSRVDADHRRHHQ